MTRHYGHSTLEVSSARTECMNQPVVTSMRDDYVDEAKQPVGVPARTSSYINTSIYIYIYIAIYTVEGMLEDYIEPPDII